MGLKGQFSQELMTVCDSQRANMAKKKKENKKEMCVKITVGLNGLTLSCCHPEKPFQD